jgi:cytochrome c
MPCLYILDVFGRYVLGRMIAYRETDIWPNSWSSIPARASMRSSLLIAIAFAAVGLSACGHNGQAREAAAVTGGDPGRGQAAIYRYGCGSCHTIAGIPVARGLVGPPLTGIGARMYVAGVLPNNAENIVRWIQDPKAVDDKTAMPTLGVSGRDATDIAAFLYSTK